MQGEKMKTQTFQITEQQPTSMFDRGSDVLSMKIWRLINSKTKYECWYIKDLEKKFKAKPQKIRRALNELVKRKYIKKIKSYPVFWEKIE